ncbi:MAG: hypothetical protein LBI27_10075, partial [Clostridiales bacterium]|nr:hypothetical protein [Clostridiales bacterium]
MSDKKNTYSSPPKPIKLKAPEFPEGYEPPKRGRGILPQLDSKPVGMPGRKTAPPEEKGLEAFRAAQRSYGAPREADEHRRRMPPPPPQIRPGDFPKRQRPGEPIKGAKAQPQRIRRTPSFIQHVLQIKINPLYVSVAAWSVVVIALGAFAVWFVSGLFVDNAYAVYLDGEFIGFISMHDDELTSEEVHQNAVLSLQAARGGVRVQVQETITIEPTR